jgi:class 3 adenylate cyclase
VERYRRGRPAGLYAIGPAVNLVSRPEGLCCPLGQPISGAVAAETTAPLVPLGEHLLRGIAAPCTVFTLPDASPALRQQYVAGRVRSQCWVRDREASYFA